MWMHEYTNVSTNILTSLKIIPDDVVQIDPTGTLRIERTQLSHRGDYRCLASNPAGKDLRDTLVVVQEPPIILPTTLSDYTTVEGDRIELRCFASANPPPVITWSRKGLAITDDTPGMHVTDDGTLVIESVENDDGGHYTCKASNAAGDVDKIIRLSVINGTLVIESVENDDGGHYTCKASNAAGDVDKIIRLSVITPPDIPDQHTIITETVIAGQPFSLYCPVFSAPLPQSRTTDAGVPPNVDESSHKLKLSVLENAPTEIGCPVSGIPSPDISWLANGQLLEEGRAKRGIVLAPGGKSVLIDSAQLYHEGIYTCVAANKAGSLDIDVQLTVLIDSAQLYHEGIYTCVAANKAGSLDIDVQLTVLG
uniref:Immunoglobulin I-set domain protein n=1 Tax=Ascaris lumbricoides TaxID=6252 RepID=A0A0M3IPD8_ASCLU